MRNHVLSAMLLTATLLAGLLASSSNAAEPKKKTVAPKNEMYAVVEIGDEIQVVEKSKLADLKKHTAEEDKQKMKAYEDAKKNPGKDRGNAELTKPAAHKVKVLKNSIKSKPDAQDWMEKFLEDKDNGDSKTTNSKKTTDW